MKRFFRTLIFAAVAAVATVSISSCRHGEEDDPKTPVQPMSGATAEAFYNGLTANPSRTILIDTRDAEKYNESHVKYNGNPVVEAISMPLTDNVFYDNDHQFYKDVEKLDPDHSKFILITDEGSSPLVLKVGGVLSGMGWNKERIYLLMNSTSDFLEKYPELDSSKQ